MSNNKLCVRSGILCLMLLGTVACQNQKLHGPPASGKGVMEQSLSPEETRKQREDERLQLCQKQLSALHNIDVKQFQHYKQEFDSLMSGASQYASLRLRVNNDTQETVDALYHYKVNYLCAGVDNAVLTGLMELAK